MTQNGAQETIGKFRVTKKLSVSARGAIKLARQYGDSLVCVRYRVDADERYRYTTVELVVERALIRRTGDAIVCVRTALFLERSRVRLVAAGAVWDPNVGLWRMPRRVAIELGLADRIVRC